MGTLKQNKMAVFSYSIVFVIGGAVYWRFDTPFDQDGVIIQYSACAILGAILGYHRLSEPQKSMVVRASDASVRMALGWWVLLAAVERFLTGDALFTIAKFPSIVLIYFAILGATFVIGDLAYRIVSRNLKFTTSVWTAVSALALVAALVVSIMEDVIRPLAEWTK